jgi:hypothetical protein
MIKIEAKSTFNVGSKVCVKMKLKKKKIQTILKKRKKVANVCSMWYLIALTPGSC